MIYPPTDCMPYLSTVDAAAISTDDFRFQVSGGKMVAYQYFFYDFYNEGNAVTPGKVNVASSPVYGGLGEESYVFPDMSSLRLTNGKDYKYKIRLWEEVDDTNPTPSNWISYGRVASPNTAITFNIRPHLNIPTGSYTGLSEKYYIKVNGQTKRIKSYTLEAKDEPTYGTVQLESALNIKPLAGVRYEIYSDFVDSGEFYFYARSNPSFSVSVPGAVSSAAINVTGVYSQTEGVKISCYKCILKDVTDGEKTLDETAEVYSELVKYSYSGLLSGHKYRLIINGETVLGMKFSASSDFKVQYDSSISYISPTATYDKELHCITINLSEFLTIKGEFSSFDYSYEDITLTDGNSSRCLKLGSNTLSYSKINTYKDLVFPEDYTVIFQVKLDKNFNGEIFSGTDNVGCVITFADGVFDYRFYNGDAGYYNAYTGGEEKVMSPSQTADKSVKYLWNNDMENFAFRDDYYWLENNVAEHFWFTVVIKCENGQGRVDFYPTEGGQNE